MENVSFMFKHFNETIFQSGISTLINGKAFHDTNYKHYSMAFKNSPDFLLLTFKLSYVTDSPFEPMPNTDDLNIRKLLNSQTKLI